MRWLRKDRGIDTEAKIENLFASGTSVIGTIKAQGNVRIDGALEGELSTDGNIIVGKGADLCANLVGKSVLVAGIVHGDICAEGRLEILPSGRVWGDVQVGSLQIAEGGLLRGACVMSGEDEERPSRRGGRSERVSSSPETVRATGDDDAEAPST